MAETCCICGNKVGKFSIQRTLRDDLPDKLVCPNCSDMKERLGYRHSSNQMAMMSYEGAVDYFKELLSKGIMKPAVSSTVESLLGITEEEKREMAKEQARIERNEERFRFKRDQVLLTTGPQFDGYEIVAYHGVYSGDCLMGAGIVADAKAIASNVVGIESLALGDKVSAAKDQALSDLIKKAVYADGNAVLGITFDVYSVGVMMGVSAAGTSVTIRRV